MKRTANIVIRVTPKERKALEVLAKKEGLTLSAWIRRFAYRGQPPMMREEVK